MKYIEVFVTDVERETQEVWFRVKLDNGEVDLSEVPDSMRDVWEKYGIPYRGKVVKPKDGEEFLRAVSTDLNGSMVRSDDIRGK